MEHKKDADVLENKYAISNDLIRMPNSLSINALKFLGLVLSKIDWHEQNQQNNDFIEVETSVNEVIKAFGVSSNNYDFYIKGIFDMQDKATLTLDHNKNLKSIGSNETKDDKKKFLNVRRLQLFPDIWVDEEHNKIKVAINNRLNGFIEMLSSNFTVFAIANTCNFKSRYAYVLYMNLCSWQDHSQTRQDQLDERIRYYTTKQLKDMFDLSVDDYMYKDHFQRKNFETFVIDKAVDEINKYSNIQVAWKKQYKGKRVEKYIFEYFRKDTFEDANTGYFNY